jgi:hypothetical protein
MGEQNMDGGQFFTQREVIPAMVLTLDPAPDEMVYDPCCGNGGCLAEAFGHMARTLGDAPAATEIERLKHKNFFGCEKENLVFPIALSNVVLHGIDQPEPLARQHLDRSARGFFGMQGASRASGQGAPTRRRDPSGKEAQRRPGVRGVCNARRTTCARYILAPRTIKAYGNISPLEVELALTVWHSRCETWITWKRW